MAKTVERKEEEEHPGDEQGEHEPRAQSLGGARLRRAQVRNRDARRSRQRDLEGLAAVAAVPAAALAVGERARSSPVSVQAKRVVAGIGLVSSSGRKGTRKRSPSSRDRELWPFEGEERMHLEEEVGARRRAASRRSPERREPATRPGRVRPGRSPAAPRRRSPDLWAGPPGPPRAGLRSPSLRVRCPRGQRRGRGRARRYGECTPRGRRDSRGAPARAGSFSSPRLAGSERSDRGWGDRSDRIDHVLFVAEAHQAAGQVVASRCGEEEMCSGERGGAREVDPGRVSGVAAVLPIDMPAGLRARTRARGRFGLPDRRRGRRGGDARATRRTRAWSFSTQGPAPATADPRGPETGKRSASPEQELGSVETRNPRRACPPALRKNDVRRLGRGGDP